jgi:hypothetical protein
MVAWCQAADHIATGLRAMLHMHFTGILNVEQAIMMQWWEQVTAPTSH